jgi:hypothetical protein
MLQILTGRFFEGKRKLEEQETEAVLYSNFWFLREINTPVGVLNPARYGTREATAFVFRYVNKYERASDRDPMVLAHSDEAVDQFRALCTLWFRALFHPDRAFVEAMTRPFPRGFSGGIVPARYVDRYFTASVESTHEEREGFSTFLNSVLSLPREKYLRVITCVRAFCDSLEALGINYDVAYSLLIYMLEALGKASDEKFTPVWEDYEEGQRKKLDKLCEEMHADLARRLRETLISTPHLKLSKRFVDFVSGNVQDSFFTTDAVGRTWPIRKSELPRLLKNLYTTRSVYVHELEEVLDDHRHVRPEPTDDTTRHRNEPYLTYSGLVRLARAVLLNFITTAPKLNAEQTHWRGQLPGIVSVEMSPEYWIWRTEGFESKHAKHRFSGVAAHFLDLLPKDRAMMAPIGPLVEMIDGMIPNAPKEHLPALIGIYWLYNCFIVPDHQRPNWEQRVQEVLEKATECHMEYLVSAVLSGGRAGFDATASENAYREYLRHRHKPLAVWVAGLLDVAVLCHIANLYHEEGKLDDHRRLLSEAILDAPFNPNLQQRLSEARDGGYIVDVSSTLGRRVRVEPPINYEI